jgi:hypothetical protein
MLGGPIGAVAADVFGADRRIRTAAAAGDPVAATTPNALARLTQTTTSVPAAADPAPVTPGHGREHVSVQPAIIVSPTCAPRRLSRKEVKTRKIFACPTAIFIISHQRTKLNTATDI